MKILTFEEFILFYEKNKRLPYNLDYGNCFLNEKKIKEKYNKYLLHIDKILIRNKKQIEKLKIKKQYIIDNKLYVDEKWEKLKQEVHERANYKCEITPYLTNEENIFVNKNIFKDLEILDCMHIISRSSSEKLYYNKDNIILGKRYFHIIDQYINPFTLKFINKEERNNFFIRFVGIERFNWLQNNK